MQEGVNKAAVYFLLAFLPIVFLVRCAFSPNISGKWQEPGEISSIEFRQDGIFTVVDDSGMTVSGNYTLLANDKIRFEIKYPDASTEIIAATVETRDDELIFLHWTMTKKL